MGKMTERQDKVNVVSFVFVPQLKSFLKFVSLQVGISIITFYFCVGAMCSIMANMTMLNPSMPISCVLIATLNTYIIVTWIMAISGSFSENKLRIKMAVLMWSGFIAIWIFCVSFTFLKFDTQILCLDHRCPESFWVYNNTYYTMTTFQPIMKPPTTPMPIIIPLKLNEIFNTASWRYPGVKSEPYLKMEESEKISVKEKNQSALIRLVEEETTEEDLSLETIPQNMTSEEEMEMDPEFDFWTNNTTGLIISVLMITKNLIIMIYSWLVLMGYYAEMICIENCMCNDEELTCF